MGGLCDTRHSKLDNSKYKVHNAGINMVCLGTRESLPEHREEWGEEQEKDLGEAMRTGGSHEALQQCQDVHILLEV